MIIQSKFNELARELLKKKNNILKQLYKYIIMQCQINNDNGLYHFANILGTIGGITYFFNYVYNYYIINNKRRKNNFEKLEELVDNALESFDKLNEHLESIKG